MTDTKTSTAKRNCDGQPSLAPATCSAHGILHHTARIENWHDLKPGVRVEWDALKVPHRNEYLRVYQGTVVACENQPGGIAVKPDKSEHEAIIWWLDNLRIIAPNVALCHADKPK